MFSIGIISLRVGLINHLAYTCVDPVSPRLFDVCMSWQKHQMLKPPIFTTNRLFGILQCSNKIQEDNGIIEKERSTRFIMTIMNYRYSLLELNEDSLKQIKCMAL